jgi:hypothetical protein
MGSRDSMLFRKQRSENLESLVRKVNYNPLDVRIKSENFRVLLRSSESDHDRFSFSRDPNADNSSKSSDSSASKSDSSSEISESDSSSEKSDKSSGDEIDDEEEETRLYNAVLK